MGRKSVLFLSLCFSFCLTPFFFLLFFPTSSQAKDSSVAGPAAVHDAPFSLSTSGNHTLVAAKVGKIIRVLSFRILGCDAVGVYLTDGAGKLLLGDSTNRVLLDPLGGSGYAGLQFSDGVFGMFETGEGEGLVLNLDVAKGVIGVVNYVVYTP